MSYSVDKRLYALDLEDLTYVKLGHINTFSPEGAIAHEKRIQVLEQRAAASIDLWTGEPIERDMTRAERQELIDESLKDVMAYIHKDPKATWKQLFRRIITPFTGYELMRNCMYARYKEEIRQVRRTA